MTDIQPAITDENEDLRAREKRLPKVRTTSGTMVLFNATQIIDSLVLEANLSRPDAHLVIFELNHCAIFYHGDIFLWHTQFLSHLGVLP